MAQRSFVGLCLILLTIPSVLGQGTDDDHEVDFTFTAEAGPVWMTLDGCNRCEIVITELAGGDEIRGRTIHGSLDAGSHRVRIIGEDADQADWTGVLPNQGDVILNSTHDIEFDHGPCPGACIERPLLAPAQVQHVNGTSSQGIPTSLQVPMAQGSMLYLRPGAASHDLTMTVRIGDSIVDAWSTPRNTSATRIPALLIPSDGAGNWTIELGTESVQSIWSLEMRLLEVGGASNQSCGWSDGRTHPTLIIPTTGEARTSLLMQQGAFANISSRQHLAMGILSVAQQLELEGTHAHVWTLPGAEALHLEMQATEPSAQCATLLRIETHADPDGEDLPSSIHLPTSQPPTMSLNGTSWRGELTRPLNDFSDAWVFEVPGNPNSEHLINVEVTGEVEDLHLELHTLGLVEDEEATSRILDGSRTDGRLSLTAQMHAGRHVIVVRHVSWNLSDGWSFGDDEAPSLNYSISGARDVLDEGTDPWFPASEEVIRAGTFIRWALGFAFLVPALTLAVVRVSRRTAWRRTLARSNLAGTFLDHLRSVAKSEAPDVARTDLGLALRMMRQTTWDRALKVWGPANHSHRTDGLELMVWLLNEDLTSHDRALVVGMRSMSGTWEHAALRFEADLGPRWTVMDTEPKMLRREDEVFLDVIGEGRPFFGRFDLDGSGEDLRLTLTGLNDGTPEAVSLMLGMQSTLFTIADDPQHPHESE